MLHHSTYRPTLDGVLAIDEYECMSKLSLSDMLTACARRWRSARRRQSRFSLSSQICKSILGCFLDINTSHVPPNLPADCLHRHARTATPSGGKICIYGESESTVRATYSPAPNLQLLADPSCT